MAIDRTNYNALVDDSGAGTDGSFWDRAAIKDVLLDPIDAAIAIAGGGATVQTTTSTGTQHNFAATAAGHLVLRANNATLLTLTGIAAGSAGNSIDIVSVGAGQVDITNQDAGSTAANRVINGVTGTISLAAGVGRATLVYDGTTARWRVHYHEQGLWIAVPYTAGDFTGSGSMTWTVDSGDLSAFRYKLTASVLSVYYTIGQTSVGGTPSTALQVKIPGGFTGVRGLAIGLSDDAGAGLVTAYTDATSTNIRHYRNVAANLNWSASTNTTTVTNRIDIEVA